MRRILIVVAVLASAAFAFGQSSRGNRGSSSTTTQPVLPSFVTIGSQVGVGTGLTVNITPPASIVNGNVLMAFVHVEGVATTEVFTPATGFTQIGSTVTSVANSKEQIGVFCKVASNESGNYTFSWATGGITSAGGIIMQLSGTSCTTDGTGSASGNAQTITIGALSPTNVNDLVAVFSAQNSNPTTLLINTPGGSTKQSVNNDMGIWTIPNAQGSTGSIKLSAVLNGAGASGVTNDFVGLAVALAPSTTATNNSVGNNSPALLSYITDLGGADISGDILSRGRLIIGSAGAIYFTNPTTGNLEKALSTNGSNLVIDSDGNYTFISTNGGNRGGPDFLLSSGRLRGVSQDLSQDLSMMFSDSTNLLWIGCVSTSDCGVTQSTETQIVAPGTHLVHLMNGTSTAMTDRFASGDSKSLTSGVAATLLSIPLATNQTTGGVISWTALATDGAGHNCSAAGQTAYAAENSAGTFVTNASVLGTAANACTAGSTLSCTFAITSANPALVQTTCTLGTLTPTSFTMTYNINHGGATEPTF